MPISWPCRGTRSYLAILIAVSSFATLGAQSATNPASSPIPTISPVPTVAATVQPSLPPGQAGMSELARRYLDRDIESSTFEELAARLRLLKLSDQGTSDVLKSRLREHYGLGPVLSSAAPGIAGAESAMLVTIESASIAKYVTIEEVNENYMKLSGGVVLTINDSKNNTVHRISADEIMYNKQKEVMTARGNVVYILTENGKAQTFSGKEMDFSLPDSDGVFLDGALTKDQTIKGATLTFVVKGTRISRSKRNLVVLDDAKLTSSTLDPPAYTISASKIWLLQPGEWAINDAVLFVGRVPVFYFPFFFYPGDESIFHPVVGYNSVEGAFLQTSTYLLGKKPAATSSISFLQIDNGQTGDYDNRYHGIFMEKVPKATKTDTSTSSNSGQFIKILADMYTTMGYFSGIQGDLKSAKITQLNFLGGLGFSRALYDGFGDTKTNIYNGSYEYWDQGFLGGVKLPFRFALDLATQLSLDNFNLTITLKSGSDPFVHSDFLTNRKEDIDWGKVLGINKDSVSTTSLLNSRVADTMSMSLSSTLTINTPFFGQFLPSIRLSKFDLALGWNTLYWKSMPAEVSSAYRSANTQFYAPALITLPNVGLSMNGTFIQYPAVSSNVVKPAANDSKDLAPELKDLLPPWDETEKTEENPLEGTKGGTDTPSETIETAAAPGINDSDYRIPFRPGAANQTTANNDWQFKLGYSFDPDLGLQSRFKQANINTPNDISSDLDYVKLQYALSGKLLYSLMLPRGYLTFDGNLALDKKDGSLLQAPLDSVDGRIGILTALADYRGYSVVDTNTLGFYPLKSVTGMENSSIKYGIGFIAIRYRNTGYDSQYQGIYTTETLDWNPTMVTSHYTSINYSLNATPFTYTLTGLLNLPPLVRTLDVSSAVGYGQANLNAHELITIRDTDGTWGPIALSLSLPFTNWLTSTSNMTVDPPTQNITNFSSNLALGNSSTGVLTTSLTALQTTASVFNNTTGWTASGDSILRVKTASIGYNLAWKSDPFWYNRVTTGISTNISWTQDLLQVNTTSSLTYSLQWTLGIFEFLDFSINVSGANSKMYRYFPEYNRKVGILTDRNFFTDLGKSFNFFNINDRYESYFKMNTLSLDLKHYLGDWELDLNYSGNPIIKTDSSTQKQTSDWNSVLTISVAWKPIPEISKSFTSTGTSTENTLTVK